MKQATIYAAGVLAGAYRGRDISARELLKHAVADAPIAIGRLKRDAGEALCDRSIHVVDSEQWEPITKVTCPRCKTLLRRW